MTIHIPDSAPRIHDQGFRPYDGPIRRPSSATWTLCRYTIGRSVGRRRKFRFKLVPIFAALFVFVVVAGYVIFAFVSGVPSVAPGEESPYFEYVRDFYRWAVIGVALLSVSIPPQVLSGDRRGGLLNLYMTTPLSRSKYVSAQGIAFLSVTAMLAVPAFLLLLVVYSLLGKGPGDIADFLNFLWRIPVGSLTLALLPVALGMAFGVMVRRGSLGAVYNIALLWITFGVARTIRTTNDISDSIFFMSPIDTALSLTRVVFGGRNSPELLPYVPNAVIVLGYLAWVVAAMVYVFWRSRKFTESL